MWRWLKRGLGRRTSRPQHRLSSGGVSSGRRMRRWLKRGLGRRMSGPQHRLSGSGGSSGYQLGVNGCISHRREWVRRRAPIFAPKVLVGNISNGFGEGTEVWGAGYPSHGQYQGESDKGFFIRKVREYHAQRGDGGC